MAILWCGGEDIDFPNGTAFSIDTSTTAARRTAYARCTLTMNSANSMGRSVVFPGGAVTSAWLTARMYYGNVPPSGQGGHIGVGLSGTSKGLFVGGGASTGGKVTLYKYDGTTWTALSAESGTSLASGSLYKLDMQVTSYGASATVNVYWGGSLIITYSGDVTVSGMTNFDSVFSAVGAFASYGATLSEMIVASEDTRLMGLCTLAPSAAGDANAWTQTTAGANGYQDINDVTIDDSKVWYVNSTAQDGQVNLLDLPAGAYSVKAVKIAARCAMSVGSTPTNIDLGIKSGGTIDPGASQALGTSWAYYERYMATNPVTSAAFTVSDANALQLNFRSA